MSQGLTLINPAADWRIIVVRNFMLFAIALKIVPVQRFITS